MGFLDETGKEDSQLRLMIGVYKVTEEVKYCSMELS